MQLSVKKRGHPPNDLRFKTGPIYIGRQVGSQIFLPDKSVSRQHAVIYQDSTQKWVIEDLASTNKTYVNKQAIHKHPIKDDDILKVGDFIIRVSFKEPKKDNSLIPKKSIHLDDTIAEGFTDLQQIIRQPEAKNAPPISLPASRSKDLRKALKAILKTKSMGELHLQLISLMLGQFSAHDAWAAIRTNPDEPMAIEGGRQISSEIIRKDQLAMHVKISYAMEKQKFILIPQLPRRLNPGRVRSIMIAPIVQGKKCLGALYLNNATEHERFELADLDYLLILTAIAESQLERF